MDVLKEINTLYKDYPEEERREARKAITTRIKAGEEAGAVLSEYREKLLPAQTPSEAEESGKEVTEGETPQEGSAETWYRYYCLLLGDTVTGYIENNRQGDKRNPSKWFPDLCRHLRRVVRGEGKPIDYGDTNQLQGLWDCYKDICSTCETITTIEMFSEFTDIGRDTFYKWLNGRERLTTGHGVMVQRWRKDCEGSLDYVTGSEGGSSANRIFLLKAKYGYTETAPRRVEVDQERRSIEQIAGELGLITEK